ncbi:spindle and kinetochore-associated protein 2 isoform X2 [Trachypithecus francoisi]|uniref:spindle and kinetochore-associated protein 2 isoform X2 n=2 Tax=Trachypithecus francoisi TaxID=54180 RepID=UPI00141BCF24|nr:spindle and kinetochore-associated protein 2 isoform X2 [Trachypithecus francoisi]
MKSRLIILIQQASEDMCLSCVVDGYSEFSIQKNPVTLLKELSAIKSRYQTLYARFKPVAVDQKETKSRVCATVNKTMNVIQKLQKQTDLELSPLTKEEKTAAEQFKSHMPDL